MSEESIPELVFESPYLYRTPHGSVLRCTRCGRLDLHFRQASFRLDDAAFFRLVRAIRRLAAQAEQHHSPIRYQFNVEDGPKRQSTVLSPEDLPVLRDLLAGAAAIIELEQLLGEVLYAGR